MLFVPLVCFNPGAGSAQTPVEILPPNLCAGQQVGLPFAFWAAPAPLADGPDLRITLGPGTQAMEAALEEDIDREHVHGEASKCPHESKK